MTGVHTKIASPANVGEFSAEVRVRFGSVAAAEYITRRATAYGQRIHPGRPTMGL